MDMFELAEKWKLERVMLQAGTHLAYPGDSTTTSHIIISGKIRQYDVRDSGSEVTLNVYGKGAVINLYWVFYGGESHHFFQAIEDSEIASAPTEKFKKEFETNHALALGALSRLVRGIDGILDRLAAHGSNDASLRVLTELRIDALRFGKRSNKGVTVTIKPSELAARTGMARETVSRSVKHLESDGLLRRVSAGYELPHE
jgi:CRP/FNR family cyclic AMP-dependent transcriptional regulator